MNKNRHLSYMKLTAVVTLLALLVIESGRGQGSAGSGAMIEPRYLVDIPTAGIIPAGNLAVDMDFFESGGLLFGTSIGAFDRFVLGISYGGSDIIGSDRPTWNPLPGFLIKLRLIDESLSFPAIAIGFDSQGRETYLTASDRYTIKSPGLYAVMSKNYAAAGDLSIHFGINYSFERADNDRDPNVFGGIEKSVGSIASLVGEYSLGANDSNHDARGRGRGYLNVGIRTSIGKGFTLGFQLKDLLQNQQQVTIGNRTIQLEFVQPL